MKAVLGTWDLAMKTPIGRPAVASRMMSLGHDRWGMNVNAVLRISLAKCSRFVRPDFV